MNVEMKDTLMKAAQYATEDKHMQMKKTDRIYPVSLRMFPDFVRIYRISK